MIVNDGIADFVGLHVERSAGIIGPLRLCSSDFRDSGDGSASRRARCHLQKRSTMDALGAFRRHLSVVLGHTFSLLHFDWIAGFRRASSEQLGFAWPLSKTEGNPAGARPRHIA